MGRPACSSRCFTARSTSRFLAIRTPAPAAPGVGSERQQAGTDVQAAAAIRPSGRRTYLNPKGASAAGVLGSIGNRRKLTATVPPCYGAFVFSGALWADDRRPHPYHGTTGNRCANRRFPSSRPTVAAEVIGSLAPKVCVLIPAGC